MTRARPPISRSLPLLAAALLVLPTGSAQTLGVPLGPFAEDHGVTRVLALADGRVLVSTSGLPLAFEADGTPLGEFNDGRISSRPLVQLSDGRVLISDRDDVLAFSPDGTYLGPFVQDRNSPIDAAELADGRVLIAEYGTNGDGRVSRFEADGTPRGVFARDALSPTSVLQLADGRVLIAESNRAEVSAFTSNGTRIGPFIDDALAFSDIAQLHDGRVLVSDLGIVGLPGAEVLVFTPEGEYLGPFTDGLGDPLGITVHPDGRVLVVDQSDDTVYAYEVRPPVAGEPLPEDAAVSAVHPSPARSGTPATLAVSLAELGTITVTVLGATGREVLREIHTFGAGRQSVEVETEGLAPGVYAVRVSGPGVEAVRRLVVVR